MNESQINEMKKKLMSQARPGNTIVDKYVNEMGKIDINLAADVLCEKCESDKFRFFHYLKKIPEISSPSGKAVIIPIQAFSCLNCDHVNADFSRQSQESREVLKGE